MSDKTNSCLPVGRVGYQSVFTPTAFSEGQKEKYSLTLLFPKTTDLSKLKEQIEEKAQSEWKGKKRSWRNPIRDGDEMDNEIYHGNWFVRLTSQYRPGVVNRHLEPLTEADGEFYSGCMARATYNLYTYDYQGNSGVALGLQNVQKVGDGEPLVSRVSADADFDALPEEVQF